MTRPALLFSLLGLLAWCTACGNDRSTTLRVEHAWARTTPTGATNGVVYFRLTSPVEDRVLGASVAASVAGGTELHETMAAGGGAGMPNMPGMDPSAPQAMTMEPVDHLDVPAGGTLELSPGEKHLMLVDLHDPLTAGSHLQLTLHLATGGDLPVDVIVADNPPWNE